MSSLEPQDRRADDAVQPLRSPRRWATEKIVPFLWFDDQAVQRVMSAMLKMTKIDIAELERAYAAGA
jgi:hypothetical protein